MILKSAKPYIYNRNSVSCELTPANKKNLQRKRVICLQYIIITTIIISHVLKYEVN